MSKDTRYIIAVQQFLIACRERIGGESILQIERKHNYCLQGRGRKNKPLVYVRLIINSIDLLKQMLPKTAQHCRQSHYMCANPHFGIEIDHL